MPYVEMKNLMGSFRTEATQVNVIKPGLNTLSAT
jgi:hypothetical protein